MKVVIEVRLKKGILDPQGKAVNNALHHLGFHAINNVRVGKLIEFNINEKDREKNIKDVEDACSKLLTNPIIEEYIYRLIEE